MESNKETTTTNNNKKKLIDTENMLVVTKGGGWESAKWVKGVKVQSSVIKQIGHRDVKKTVVPVAHNLF